MSENEKLQLVEQLKEIPEQKSRLLHQLNRLEGAADGLIERMETVVTENDESGKDNKEEATAETSLGEDLRSYVARVASVACKLESARERVQL